MEEQKKQKKKSNIKKVFGGVLALVLVAVISVVGTLAYLGSTTGNTVENVFKGSDDISVQLTETEWTKNGGGQEKAQHYTPNLKIEKNPVIPNNTTVDASDTGDYSEWVAIRVDYHIGNESDIMSAVTFADFTNSTNGVISSFNDDTNNTAITDFSDRDWLKVTPKSSTSAKFDIYVYKSPLAKGASTNSLFDSVTVNKDIKKVGTDPNKKYPQFKINVIGAAIKNEQEFAITELTSSKLTYQNASITTSNDYIIMNELVKLLTSTDKSGATDYSDFTGIKS